LREVPKYPVHPGDWPGQDLPKGDCQEQGGWKELREHLVYPDDCPMGEMVGSADCRKAAERCQDCWRADHCSPAAALGWWVAGEDLPGSWVFEPEQMDAAPGSRASFPLRRFPVWPSLRQDCWGGRHCGCPRNCSASTHCDSHHYVHLPRNGRNFLHRDRLRPGCRRLLAPRKAMRSPLGEPGS
jgi:hypothetical protein